MRSREREGEKNTIAFFRYGQDLGYVSIQYHRIKLSLLQHFHIDFLFVAAVVRSIQIKEGIESTHLLLYLGDLTGKCANE